MCMWKKSEWWNERWMGPPIQPKTLNCQIDWNITPKLYTLSLFINKSFAQNIPEGRGSRVQNLVLLEPLEKGQGQEQLVLLGQEAELQGQQSQLSLVYPESQNQQFKSDSWNRVSFIPNMKRKGKNYVLIPHEHRPYLTNKMKTLAELVNVKHMTNYIRSRDNQQPSLGCWKLLAMHSLQFPGPSCLHPFP